MIKYFLTSLALIGLAACSDQGDPDQATAPTAATDGPVIKPWGYPLDALDRSVDPGDDFFRFANGGWLDATEIPSDRSGAGFSFIMRERNEDRIATIISDLASADVAEGTNEQKIRDLYASFMDTNQIEALALTPIEADLATIAALQTREDVARAMADTAMGLPGPFAFFVNADAKAPETYAVYATHSGLGLPDKSYYVRESDRLETVRTEYVNHVERMLGLIDYPEPRAAAEAIFNLEKAIASHHWTRAERRNADKTYNKMPLADLTDLAPGFPWNVYAQASSISGDVDIIVRENTAFPGLAQLFADTNVDIWKTYLTYRYLAAHSRFLPDTFAQESFAFYGKILSGQQEPRPRDKRGIDLVNGQLNQAVGEIYIDRFFPEESKILVTELFENVRSALKTRIENLTWMTADTKEKALEKLAKITPKIAYPDIWYDYSAVTISPDDLIGNIKRIRVEATQKQISRLGQTVDKREWFTGPQTVNAFYSPTRNEAFVPAGYIQSPLFDPKADPAINYGALGSIIGHEIGHGFDDQGSKYDGDGVLQSWWTEQDRAAFDALGDRLADQFSQYEPLPGLNVNGRQTLGENIGDLAGVVVAYHAYLLSLDGKEPPVLDGFTGQQRVFLGRAQGRRFKQTEAALRRRLLSAPHSPMNLRVNGMVRNIDEWYVAFGIEPEDEMYLSSEERVRIW